jgi:hypothetical protein
VQPHGPGISSEFVEGGATRQGAVEVGIVVAEVGVAMVTFPSSEVVGMLLVVIVAVLVELGFSQSSQSVGSNP